MGNSSKFKALSVFLAMLALLGAGPAQAFFGKPAARVDTSSMSAFANSMADVYEEMPESDRCKFTFYRTAVSFGQVDFALYMIVLTAYKGGGVEALQEFVYPNREGAVRDYANIYAKMMGGGKGSDPGVILALQGLTKDDIIEKGKGLWQAAINAKWGGELEEAHNRGAGEEEMAKINNAYQGLADFFGHEE